MRHARADANKLSVKKNYGASHRPVVRDSLRGVSLVRMLDLEHQEQGVEPHPLTRQLSSASCSPQSSSAPPMFCHMVTCAQCGSLKGGSSNIYACVYFIV